ncbi:MAG: hypothetical protein JXR58_12020 [Bacteroidales bacterium]|nr:hypothetical protein [Bacteroidales bacterium]
MIIQIKYQPNNCYFLGNTFRILLISIFLSLNLFINSVAQDSCVYSRISTINKYCKISGGLNYGISFQQNQNNLLPQNLWNFSANINIKVLNILNLPFSYTASSQNKQFNKPAFSRFGISPKYKNLTVHLGYRTLSFSEFTLASLMFKGFAVNYILKSQNLNITTIYGNFTQPDFTSQPTQAIVNNQDPTNPYAIYPSNAETLKTIGKGIKISRQTISNSYSIIFFNFLKQYNNDSLSIQNLTIQQNSLFSIEAQQKISSRLSFNSNFFLSLFPDYSKLSELVYISSHSRQSTGWNFSLKYSLKNKMLSINHLHIPSDYFSIGAPFLQNNLNQYSISLNLGLFKNLASFSINSGIMQNNLDNKLNNTSKRIISSIQAGIKISKAVNLSIIYSNFSLYSLPVRIEFTDSVRFLQVTENAGVAANFSKQNNKIQQNIMLSGQYQKARQIQRTEQNMPTNQLVNLSFNYNLKIKKLQLAINSGINKSINLNTQAQNLWLPSIRLSKKICKNGGEIAGSTMLYLSKNSTVSHSQSISYNNTILKKININLSYQLSNRNNNMFTAGSAQISYTF